MLEAIFTAGSPSGAEAVHAIKSTGKEKQLHRLHPCVALLLKMSPNPKKSNRKFPGQVSA